MLIIISSVVLLVTFVAVIKSYNQVHNAVLKQDVEQMIYTSTFVTKLVESEIENAVSALSSVTKFVLQYGELSDEETIQKLQKLCEELNYKKLGIADLQGKTVDSDGDKFTLDKLQLLETIKEGDTYISSSTEESGCLLLAAPIFNRQNILIGFIWGYYPVLNISENINLDYNSYRYFQIIDDTGKYISEPNNMYSFSMKDDIWEELKRYQIEDSVTIEKIQEDVSEGKSGEFYFSYEGQGRYVSYEPLGINNWYVFSVLVEEHLSEYTLKIERVFLILLIQVIGILFLLAGIIGREIYKTTALIKEQNNILESKNQLLFMSLKHTNDVPFEIDLKENTICMYYSKPEEKTIAASLYDYAPDMLLEKDLIEKESYEAYKKIFDGLLNKKSIPAVPIRFKTNGLLDICQIYYEFITENKIVGCLEDYNEIAKKNEKIDRISKKSQMDALTQLYNREYIAHEVERRIQELRNEGKKSALFIVDLDHFKEANDTLGHVVGDHILTECALKMKTILRTTDLCGRLGGDEFVLFVQDVNDIKSIQRYAEKLNKSLRKIYSNSGKSVEISASIGVAVVTTETTFQELYKLADTALYTVKNQGRDGYFIQK